ncbi:MAG TPA: cation transporter [Saprospiraceae bacterium]|nr:cation transporter [Saprospiraceae bacterium]
MKHTYNVSGMTCAGCESKVKYLLSQINGVKNVKMDLSKGTAEIEMDGHISTDSLIAALKDYPKYQLSEYEHIPINSSINIEEQKSWFVIYKPILIIFTYITAISILVSSRDGEFSILEAMRVFMSGFFLTFSFFKMLDLRGFVDGYAMYDLVAKRFRFWGYIYAFLELGLGLTYASNFQPGIINFLTFLIMSVSIVGVLQSVLNKRKIKCACLGAVFNLPMSTITIIEDGLMIAMSAIMLILMY